ncbi:MAG: hypothetical protein HRT38_00750 [Alteromonadaceae bacterium]|nr:hypothetical protein [Alteromonadaceae bacterium]
MKQVKRKAGITANMEIKTSRRGLFKKAAIGVPIVMTLANRPAYGAVCSISGFQSVNPSGVKIIDGSCGGFSPRGWTHPDEGGGATDGSRKDWYDAGYNPNPRISEESGRKKKRKKARTSNATGDPLGTLFSDRRAFGKRAPGYPSDATLHDILIAGNGTLVWHAIANFLNAGLFVNYRLSQLDVVGLYWAYVDLDDEYTTDSGTVINMAIVEQNTGGLQSFFDQYH